MPRGIRTAAWTAFCLGAALVASSDETVVPTLSAQDLIARVLDARKIHGLSGRVRLLRFDSRTGSTDVQRLVMKLRREGEATRILYRVVAPRKASGRALVLDLVARERATGLLFEGPDRVVALSGSGLEIPFFGSDLKVSDLTDEFLSWPYQKAVGEERLLRRLCTIVESRRDEGAATATVKSWLSPALALPLRVERFDPEGRLLRRLTVDRVAHLGEKRWIAASVTVVPAGGATRTTLEGTHGGGEAEIPAAEVDVETIRRSLRAPPAAPGSETAGGGGQ